MNRRRIRFRSRPQAAGRPGWSRAAVLASLALASACAPSAAPTPPVEPPPSPPGPGLDGFSAGAAREQRELERRFLAVPSPEGAAETGRWLASLPHRAGTDRQAALADSLAGWLRALGFGVDIERYDVLLPFPDSLSLELLASRYRDLSVREAAGDPPGDYAWSWNAYSADGTARGPAVYANYGRARDYRVLEAHGVDVRGRIVLARYGGSYRGAKVREAERRGAAGLVLFTDPADAGFTAGDTVPAGAYRPTDSVQRGTVSYLWRYPGDPLTPGRPALPGVPRLDRDQALNLPSIPVLNVGAAAARPVLEALDGPEAPDEFRGGWPLPYRLGGGTPELRMRVRQDTRLRPVRNVIARLAGREPQSVIVGVHFDAWVKGGVDPQSGVGAVLEIARGLAELRRDGWRPRREIVLAFWGAEEYGAAGSTEFVEAHREELARRAVAYFNVDVLTAGALDVSGSPSLRDLVWSAARDVADPATGEPLAEGWRARASDGGAAETPADRPLLTPLGVGSDWTAFFHHAGIPSLQWTMNGRGTYAVYHSALDDFHYLRTYADSALTYTPRMAAVMGIAALRLAEAEALPFDYEHYAERIRLLVDSAASPPAEIGGLRAAVSELEAAATRVARRRREALAAGDRIALERLNLALPRVEQAFLRGVDGPAPTAGGTAGALTDPARSWYRHMIYTSDPVSGYGSRSLPALGAGGEAAGEALDLGGTWSTEELERGLRRAAARLRAAIE